MVKDKWSDLKALVDLSFDLELQKFTKLRAEETKLVSMRDRLGEMNKDAFDQFAGVHPSHLLNGDFLWQTWVGQNLEEMGREKARMRAQAKIQKPSLRKAFGRKSVISRIMKS